MTTSINVIWHMDENGRATARSSGHLCIHEGASWAGYPTLDIYVRDTARAALAAAAINGDLAELRRLLDIADAAAMRAEDDAA